MGLSITGFTFSTWPSSGKDIYGPVDFGPYDVPIERAAFAGAKGEVELRDKIKGRVLMIPYRPQATTDALLYAKLQTLSEAAGQYHGTLTHGSTTYPNVTFEGFFPQRQRMIDGSGVNGYFQHGVLRFRQVSPE